MEIGVQISGKKRSEKKHPKSKILGSILGTIWEWACGAIALKNKCVLHVGAREAGYIKMGPKIDDVGS